LPDNQIWSFAKINEYLILTFDEDFIDIQNLYSFPPKIIWLRTGNVSTAIIAARLLELEISIIDFIANDELGVYEIYL
jgi:predicted nuclease of predicted toxin-antitoxin system